MSFHNTYILLLLCHSKRNVTLKIVNILNNLGMETKLAVLTNSFDESMYN